MPTGQARKESGGRGLRRCPRHTGSGGLGLTNCPSDTACCFDFQPELVYSYVSSPQDVEGLLVSTRRDDAAPRLKSGLFQSRREGPRSEGNR